MSTLKNSMAKEEVSKSSMSVTYDRCKQLRSRASSCHESRPSHIFTKMQALQRNTSELLITTLTGVWNSTRNVTVCSEWETAHVHLKVKQREKKSSRAHIYISIYTRCAICGLSHLVCLLQVGLELRLHPFPDLPWKSFQPWTVNLSSPFFHLDHHNTNPLQPSSRSTQGLLLFKTVVSGRKTALSSMKTLLAYTVFKDLFG